MVVNVTKIPQKMKNKSLLSIETEKKRITVKTNDLKSSFEGINLLQKAYLIYILKVYMNIDKKL